MIKFRRTTLHYTCSQRQFSSQFKKFFGFEERLEQQKIKNDTNTEFDVNKMNRIAIVINSLSKYALSPSNSSVLGGAFFVCLSKNRREKARKTLLKAKLRLKLFFLTPSFLSLIDMRIETLGQMVALEVAELEKLD